MPRCVIAEDEALLRESLVGLLAQAWPELEVGAECEDGGAALEAIAELQPEVAFLDIRMPGLSGLEVASAAIECSPNTRLVFVTAYDQYAVEAFDAGAVDYLLKPVTTERLAQTVLRVKERLQSGTPELAALAELFARLGAAGAGRRAPAPLVWITASTGKDSRLIMLEDVLYFRAEHKYTVVMTAEGEALLRKPIKDLLAILDPDRFRQVHRSTIVNLRAISSIARDDSGRGLIHLKSRAEILLVSQPFMGLFRNM
jgi:DNA-binding LytR/AlgR family response regulator